LLAAQNLLTGEEIMAKPKSSLFRPPITPYRDYFLPVFSSGRGDYGWSVSHSLDYSNCCVWRLAGDTNLFIQEAEPARDLRFVLVLNTF
jgi:hypothetical protein